MSVDSIHTNSSAMIALQSLDSTNAQLAAVQKQISTGYRVNDATDDGAAYAVAQNVRSSIGALTTANQQLGNVQGLLDVTNSGLNDVSNTLNSLKQIVVDLSSAYTQGNQRSQYQSQYNSLVSQIKSYFNGAAYNGASLIANVGGTVTGVKFASTTVVQDDQGTTYGIATYGGNALYTALHSTATGSFTSTSAQSFLTGTLATQMNKLGDELNYYGNATNYVTDQISYNSDKINALNTGLGALIDANLAQESAQLQSLQIQQQLGTQALSLANQAPATLLSLFK